MSGGIVPDWLLSIAAAITLFAVMLDLGLAIVPAEFAPLLRQPGPMLRALFAVLVAVPAIVWFTARIFDVARPAEVGMMLMAISPGAPVALRRALGAGGDRSFAPALQIALACAAIVSVPLWIAALDEYYAGSASADPRHLARQVLVAQLAPLALGMLLRRCAPRASSRLAAPLGRIATVALLALAALALIDVHPTVIDAGPRVGAAIIAATVLALATGHLLGGAAPATRTTTAIACGSRNTGLALLVAALNHATAPVVAAVLAYFVLSAVAVFPYALWRRHMAATRTT